MRLWFDDIGFITAVPTAANQAPVGVGDSYEVDEDTGLVVAAPGVLENDSDADGDSLTARLITGTTNGALSFQPDGSFRYFPRANFSGLDRFSYVASDGTTESAITTVTIMVNPINDAPFVDSPTVTTNEDEAYSGAIASIDVEGDPYEFAIESGAAHGVAVVNPDGTFSYTPEQDFNGTDHFTFRATDDQGASRLGTVTVVVLPVNDAPVARDDAYSVDEDGTLTLSATPIFRFVMESAAGDWVGQGQSYSYDDATANFDADVNFDNGVSLSVIEPGVGGDWWYLDFSAPLNVPLAPGAYEGAQRFPFQDNDRPGLDVSGNGRGHNQLTGEFTVYDVEYGAGGSVNRFAASFVQQGLDFMGTALPPLIGCDSVQHRGGYWRWRAGK